MSLCFVACLIVVLMRSPTRSAGLAALAITIALNYSRMLGYLARLEEEGRKKGRGGGGYFRAVMCNSKTHRIMFTFLPPSPALCAPFFRTISEVEQALNSAERILFFSNVESEAPYERPDMTPPDHWPDVADIEFQGVSMR